MRPGLDKQPSITMCGEWAESKRIKESCVPKVRHLELLDGLLSKPLAKCSSQSWRVHTCALNLKTQCYPYYLVVNQASTAPPRCLLFPHIASVLPWHTLFTGLRARMKTYV